MAGELGRSHAAASRQEYSSLLDKGHHTTQGLAIVTSMLLSLLDPKVLQPRKERKGWEGVEGERRLKLRFLSLSGWSPLSGLKGVNPPLQFGERTRDCSPGHAGREGPHLEILTSCPPGLLIIEEQECGTGLDFSVLASLSCTPKCIYTRQCPLEGRS